jgi:predicted phage terminase large subunit-like protein
MRFLCAASDGALAGRDAGFMRDLVECDWYRQSFRPNWTLRADQKGRSWYSNTAGGHRISYGALSRVVGRKGDCLLTDDADDARKVWSEAERQIIHQWHDHAFGGRIADEKTSPHIIVGQRVHVDDLIGYNKRRGGWVELRLAEEYDPANRCTTPVWSDPRTVAGEWLRPSRFGPAEKADAIGRLGLDGYDSQHLQDPKESSGTWFDRGRLAGILPEIPMGTLAVRYWDTAATVGETSCETAGALVGTMPDGRFVIADMVHGKWQPVDRDMVTVATAHADRLRSGVTTHTTWIEQEPGASGVADVQSMVRKLAGFHAKGFKESGDKDVRARPLAAQWQSGNVLLVAGPWNEPFLAQLARVPGAQKGRDMVDAATGGFNRLTEKAGGDGHLGLPEPDQRFIGGDVPADVWH